MSKQFLAAFILSIGLVGCGDDPAETSPGSAGQPVVNNESPDSPAAQATTATDIASSIYRNGKIYTVDGNNSWAQALAVVDGKIVAVGSNDVVMTHAGAGTVVHDLGGAMVMPGIHDTHLHPSDAGIQKTLQCSFLAGDVGDLLEIVDSCVAATPAGQWVRGGQWNDGHLASGESPKAILDKIAPNHPVFLMDWSVHNAWVNSKALAEFGINKDTPNPPGGVIVRDPQTGEATGILLDNAAYNYRRQLPTYSLDKRVEALAWSIEQIAGFGVTTFKEALVTTATMQAYAALNAQQRLPLRVKTSLTWKSSWANSHADEQGLIEVRSTFATPMIDTRFAKIMLDGIPPAYTAALLEPYAPSEAHGDQHRGELMLAPEELAKDVIALDKSGLSIKMHATGDRSVRVALDAVAAARAANDASGVMHEVSHAAMIHADDIPRFAELNVAAEMCPILWYPIAGLDWDAWLGPERAKMWPVKSLLEANALVTYGSDWPVVPTPNPWRGIEAMVTRSDPAGPGDAPDWAEEAIDLAAAIRIFTHNGAIANRAGEASGSLEVGKDADFIALDRNIFEVPVTDVGEVQVELMVVGGQTVFDKRSQ
jgi:predicted amidohydrolase YtcJ